MTIQTQEQSGFALVLQAAARALRKPFLRKEMSREEVLALWERQKHLDSLARDRNEAIVRHFHRL